ncbi:tripartite motif-containing protein 6-like [Pseudophryne corroboree]|uniref:tripartite motif-containing protein 6-like n=1 Tax=Pseudophryne corroboree TaxID=495146 RepID=UPI003081EC8D
MASADLRQELHCSICLNIYTDPVTLRCGHNFCRVCIDGVLNAQEGSRVYSCPECREEYKERPALEKNRKLCNIAEHVRSIPEEGNGNRNCSVHKELFRYYCIEDAACICVSCCLIGEHRGHQMESLDEASEKKKEKLRDVLQKLTTKRAETEKRVQSMQECRREDQGKAACITEKVTTMFRDIRRQLEDLEKRILSEISKQEQCVLLSVTDQIRQFEIKKDELSRKMRHIEELCNMSDPVTVLQEPDTGDLSVTVELSNMTDPGEGEEEEEDTEEEEETEDEEGEDTKDDTDEEEEDTDEDTDEEEDTDDEENTEEGYTDDEEDTDEEEDTEEGYTDDEEDNEEEETRMVGDLDVGLISGTLHTLSDIITGINVCFYVQEPTDLLLDVTTAGNNLVISDDCKTVSPSYTDQNCPVTPERFQCNQVISTRGFSSGRHYWEVDVSKSVWWKVGMCYPSIDRKGGRSFIDNNNKSWCLCRYYERYSVRHDSAEILLPENIPCDRVRVYLDYEAGQLSFYSLCDPIRHLHTYTAALTEPLHAALWVVGGGCITISGGVRGWEESP